MAAIVLNPGGKTRFRSAHGIFETIRIIGGVYSRAELSEHWVDVSRGDVTQGRISRQLLP